MDEKEHQEDGGATVTLTQEHSINLICDCDAPLRATSTHPRPFHRPGCRALTCHDCGQDRTSHVFGREGSLECPDGRGVE